MGGEWIRRNPPWARLGGVGSNGYGNARGGQIGRQDMRRSLTLLAAVMVLIGLIAAPAAADKPTVATPPPDVFTDIDPCTGDEMDGR